MITAEQIIESANEQKNLLVAFRAAAAEVRQHYWEFLRHAERIERLAETMKAVNCNAALRNHMGAEERKMFDEAAHIAHYIALHAHMGLNEKLKALV